MTGDSSAPAASEKEASALATNAKLIAKSAARAAGVFIAYAAVGTVFHWLAFWIAAGDIWGTLHGGPMGAHGGAGVMILILLFFTPQGLVTLIYLVGLPGLCLLLGQHAALRAAVHRILREKQGALVEFAVGISMRAVAAAGAAPGAERAGTVARRLMDSTTSMDVSRGTRYLLRAVLRAIKLPELLATTNFIARSKDDPEGARGDLCAAIEPRIVDLGRGATFRPLLIVLGATAVVTATSGLWCRLF